MSSKTRVSCLLAMTVVCLAVPRATACPYCNIHHRLAETVEVAEDIYVGKVARLPDDRTADIQVVRILRGSTHRVGATLARRLALGTPQAGQGCIICERQSHVHSFGFLPPDLEDEVLFLMQGRPRPAPRDMDEAIRRLRGVSVESARAGMDYVALHHAEAVTPLLAEINAIIPADLAIEEQFSIEYPLARFLEALLLEPTDAGRDFAFQQIDAFPSRPVWPDDGNIGPSLFLKIVGVAGLFTGLLWFGSRSFLRWRVPRNISSDGIFLRDLLRASTKDLAFADEVRERLLARCETLEGRPLGEAVYAMSLSNIATPAQIEARLENPQSAEALAWGYHLAGNYHSVWWQRQSTKPLWEHAARLAQSRRLKRAIANRIAAEDRVWNRH